VGRAGRRASFALSFGLMHDAVTSIAMFWQDLWLDFVG